MEDRACWFAVFVCFTAVLFVVADDFNPGYDARTGQGKISAPTCAQLCAELKINDGCKRPILDPEREEVIVMTNGSQSIMSWNWDTITMVVTTYFEGISKTGLTSCVAHSKGKRYGLRESVPGSYNIDEILVGDVEKVKLDFIKNITTYQDLLQADHVVFDLLHFFHQLDDLTEGNRSKAINSLSDILVSAVDKVMDKYRSEVYCVVPWEPPCPEDNCSEVRKLLGNCNALVMSPDSFMARPDSGGLCRAQATVPIAKFLYGVDRYLSLRAGPGAQATIVAGIPWHGYTYKCQKLANDQCWVESTSSGRCFDSSNRCRHSLSEIHSMNIAGSRVFLDEINKAIYFNVNETAQLWFENYTTLLIKYQLVKDLNLRGLSIWYGEDLVVPVSQTDQTFPMQSWDFLAHQVLHKETFNRVEHSHVYADTVAAIAVGCLLLGLALGVIFTYIALRRKNSAHNNRPFKLDEVDDEFRDDEGL